MGLCNSTGVEIDDSNGRIVVPDGHVVGFLEVLDRRRSDVELVTGRPEQFKAASRRRIDIGSPDGRSRRRNEAI